MYWGSGGVDGKKVLHKSTINTPTIFLKTMVVPQHLWRSSGAINMLQIAIMHYWMRSSWEFHREGWCRLQFGSGGICHLFAPSHKWVGNIRSSSSRNTRRGGEAENLFVEGSFKREVGAPTIIGRAPPGDKSPAARISSASKSNDGKTCIKFEEADLRAEITLQWSKSDLHLLHDFLECRVRRMTRG